MNDQWLLETIKAKSDQLNACDLVGGPITVTIQAVKRMGVEQPVALEIGEGRQPYKPCKNMRRVLVGAWGTEKWVGRSMTLYCDTTVKFGGQSVGGIRISHVSHIKEPLEIPLTITRGKSTVWRVEPLQVVPEPKESVADRISKVITAINLATSQQEVNKIRDRAKAFYESLTEEQRVDIDLAISGKKF